MLFGAICAGVFAFLFVGAIVGGVATHDAQSGCFPGIIAAIWAAWPLVKGHQIERYNLLRPVPKRYNVPLQQAFAAVRDIVATATYQFGNKWHVSMADTQSKRIVAMLNFSEEEGRWEGTSVGNIHRRTERVQRLVELEVQFKEEASSCIVQLDFNTKAEGVNAIYACDHVVEGVKSAIEGRLGAGTAVGNPAEFTWSAPPWWLLGITALALMSLWGDVMKSVFGK